MILEKRNQTFENIKKLKLKNYMYNDNIKESAKKYLEKGWGVIPVNFSKATLENGKIKKQVRFLPTYLEYHLKKILPEQIEQLWTGYNGIAVTTGKISGLTVMDVDTKELPEIKDLPETFTVETNKGFHFYFKYTPEPKSSAERFEKDGKIFNIDIRNDRAILYASPSEYELPDGKIAKYKIIKDIPLAVFPLEWHKNIYRKYNPDRIDSNGNIVKQEWRDAIVNPILDGRRNVDFATIIGALLNKFPPEEWESIVWNIIKDKNQLQEKPLSETELRSIFNSIASREFTRRSNFEGDGAGGETYKEGQFNPLLVSELMKRQFKDTEWLVNGLIPSGSIVAISGAPASNKTWFILDLAISVATGDILFDKFVVSQTGVLIVDEENGERLLQNRFKKLHKSFDFPIHTISLVGFKLIDRSVEDIIKFCKSNNIKLAIFDSLVRIHSSDENDAMKMSKVFNLLKRFVKEDITVVFTHHNRKQGILRSSNPSQDMRGSSDILASVDCHLAIDRKPKENLITIHQTKLRQQQEMKPFNLNIISDENDFKMEFAGEVDEIQSKKTDIKEAIKDILGQENKPMYKAELSLALKENGVKGGYSTFKTAIKELIESGEIFESKGEKNKTFCSLTSFEEVIIPV